MIDYNKEYLIQGTIYKRMNSRKLRHILQLKEYNHNETPIDLYLVVSELTMEQIEVTGLHKIQIINEQQLDCELDKYKEMVRLNKRQHLAILHNEKLLEALWE